MSQSAMQLLLTAAHIETIETKILPALAASRTVVLDRFWWSTWVYGTASGLSSETLRRLLAVEDLAWGGIVPTMLFLITRRKRAKEGNDRLTSLYRSLARREASRGVYPISLLRNDGSIDGAVRTIRARLGRRHNKR